MSGLQITLGVEINDPDLPIFYPDPLMNTGSMLLVDVTNKSSFSAQANPANNYVLNNLVDSKADGVIKYTTNPITFTGKGLQMPGHANSFVDFGESDFNLASLNPNFLVIAWIKQGNATDAYQNIFGMYAGAIATDAFQYAIESGPAGANIRASVSTEANQASAFHNNGAISDGQIAQYALSYEGNTIRLFKNGSQIQTASLARGTRLGNPSSGQTAGKLRAGGSNWKGVFYRGYVENLTVSGKTGAEQVAADFAKNSGKFS